MTVLTNEHRILADAREHPNAFAAVYEHYFPRIYTYIRYRVSDDATADDLTAFTFERALARLNRYDPQKGPFAAWLFGIARYAVINHNRKAKRRQMMPFEWLNNHPSREPAPDAVTQSRTDEERLLEAVAQLSERERDIIALKFASDLTNRRIADLMGLSASNVGVIVHRALKRLRAALEEDVT
ncbi:MAG: sigma-70 family RNA polymerase sigma factor [Chloroflexi bacterium]|nr:sigma-70 family RNA polymerase sigma factor [Chloroflexota bacterium]